VGSTVNRTYTEEEWADLYCEGKAPEDTMVCVRWVWEKLSIETRLKILETQPVVVMDRPNLGMCRKAAND
jgi:hypothetical protein